MSWFECLSVLLSGAALLLSLLASRRARRRDSQYQCLLRETADLRLKLGRDPLTDLVNRAVFDIALDELASGAGDDKTVVILFFDLDRFKEVNDTLGHKVGDTLLVEVARRAGAVLSGAKAFARLGGDEFAAILEGQDARRPEDYGRAIVEVMNETFLIDGHRVEVAASVGIALGDALLDDGHELLRRADAAMYEAKGSGRGGYRVYDDQLSGRQLRESSIRVELGKAMAARAFELHYQPIVDARTGALSSVEALLRPQSPGLRDASIEKVISVAEASGQIVSLTEWTLETAFETIKILGDLPVGVNISPVYFRRQDFLHRMFEALVGSGIRPELLTVEVTEGVLISDIAAARQSIARLREIGVRVVLDDFGTGFSSLSYLQDFELDGVKLDKSFLREIGDRKKATQIIRSIIDFGHGLDMDVVVEGVESDWQARLLQLLGSDYLQGYEIGVPMPLPELRAFADRAGGLGARPAMRKGDGDAAHANAAGSPAPLFPSNLAAL